MSAPRREIGVGLAVVAAALGMLLLAPAAGAQERQTRYSLVGNCYMLKAEQGGGYVGRDGRNYRLQPDKSTGERFRMQATTLGRYLLYGSARNFLTGSSGGVRVEREPGNGADWTVRRAGPGSFRITNGFIDRDLVVDGQGRLTVVAAGSGGSAGHFVFEPAAHCPRYPEIRANVRGKPTTGFPRYGETQGMLEGHMHHMAFRFLGGAHCGRPWHRFGVEYALVDCPDHEVADGCGAVLENLLYGDPARCHDPVGWPDFKDWPHHQSLTHEQSYYKWVERAWRSGMRVFVNLMVQNRVLCELYPIKYENTECDDSKTVDIEIREAYRLQDYIDAQEGGPGKGWYRIVRNPFQARKVINEGKMAVVLGMEVSEPFRCRMFAGVPTCNKQQISNELDHLKRQGIVQLEITNKFDNALTGVAGDGGEIGVLTNLGNFYATGQFWDLERCTEPEGEHDHTPAAVVLPHNDDLILANIIREFGTGGVLPVYPPGPHCNRRGLTELGEHAIREIVKRKMIFDPDHQSVKGRDQALALIEELDYPGVFSSHSWSTPAAYPRIYKQGGVVTPSSKGSEGFVDKWQHMKEDFGGRQYWGIGIGADQNGFATQGGPRGADAPNQVDYPFKSMSGEQTINRQRSGNRVYDINLDGVAHYGLYPDWVEDLRKLAGDEIVNDLNRGAEAYLQMWERARGVPERRCRAWKGAFSATGLGRALRLGKGPKATLFAAGQPHKRSRAWRWCTRSAKPGNRRNIAAVFDTRGTMRFAGSAQRRNRAGGVRPGDRVASLPRSARSMRGGIRVRRNGAGGVWVYGVKRGRVSFVGVADSAIASSPAALRNYAKRSRLG